MMVISQKQKHRKLTDKQQQARQVMRRETERFIKAMQERHQLWLATRDLMECW